MGAVRPILLRGHERSLTKIKYNRHGDLILTTSKDNKPNVWYADNGERLGTLNGHNGTVWDIDIDYNSNYILTASADSTMRLWDVNTGKQIYSWEFKAPVRSASFSFCGQKAVCITDAAMGQPSTIHFLDVPRRIISTTQSIVITSSKATIAKWGPMDRILYTGHEDGSVAMYDAATCKKLKSVKLHSGSIQDLQFAPVQDMGYFITASKDCTAMIYETATLKDMKTFTTSRPVNSACISPLRHHIILGGGQEAMSVTTTSQRHEKFEVRFFHAIFEDEIARCKGHFGPINTLAWSPDGKSFASGGEDGYVRVHHLAQDYFDFAFDEEVHPEEMDL